MTDEFKGVSIALLKTSIYATWNIPYLSVRTAEEGCTQWHLLCGITSDLKKVRALRNPITT